MLFLPKVSSLIPSLLRDAFSLQEGSLCKRAGLPLILKEGSWRGTLEVRRLPKPHPYPRFRCRSSPSLQKMVARVPVAAGPHR